MKFIPSRDLRVRPGKVWKDLAKERQLVITSHGQPVAVMLPVTGEDLEDKILAIRRAELQQTISRIQRESVRKGTNKLTMAEIDEEIAKARKGLK
jgi:antitoxin (DNA-binding transcriptional repressor) of toxin-antitoxin stability system